MVKQQMNIKKLCRADFSLLLTSVPISLDQHIAALVLLDNEGMPVNTIHPQIGTFLKREGSAFSFDVDFALA